MTRPSSEVLLDLKKLINAKGYIYSLCLILFEDFHHDLDKIHLVDPRSKLSVKECSLILGFLVQNGINFDFPESPEAAFSRKEKTYELMRELQFSFSVSQFSKLRDMMNRQVDDGNIMDNPDDKIDFFVKNGAIIEPLFYSGDGVYDFQYLEYLERKYKYDQQWLLKNKHFEITEVCTIVQKIKSILHEKGKVVNIIDLENILPDVLKKARKKLRKKLPPDQIKKLERQQFVSASFFQYQTLFPKESHKEKGNTENWQTIYKNLIDLFVIRESDFDRNLNIASFFKNFSFRPPDNLGYEGPGHYNILNSNPLIRLDEERYFVPINYLVPEAVYETPFYWMWKDKAYLASLSKHRGDVGEEIAFEFLSKVFGVENTYKSVLITTKKGEADTDIDVLCLLGSKALCVQVKSKKLTLLAKRGDFEQLTKDFKGAIQDAYDQGLVSRKSILDKRARFSDQDGKEFECLNNIDEVYILGLTTENYPSLVHQVHLLLKKEKEDPFPLFISIFDLELLTHYLPDPYDFLYYVRQRIDLCEYFRGAEELVYLGYHLGRKLWTIEGYDQVMLETDFGANIDRNYYPYKTGLSHLLSDQNDSIQNRWKGEKFESFLAILKSSKHPKATNFIFHLMDWSGESRENIVEQLINLKKKSIKEGRRQSLATDTRPHFGLSYIVSETIDPQELKTIAEVYSVLRKYKSKCDVWLGLGSFSTSRNLIDFILYLDEPWKFDATVEAECENFFNSNVGTLIPLGNKGKIGRNDPCPCKSGQKFKRCCGKN